MFSSSYSSLKMAIIAPLILLLRNYRSVKHILTPGLASSIILSSLFLAYRKFPPVCSRVPTKDGDVCTFEWREGEVYMFLMCFVMIKNRSAVSLQQMIETFLTFSKLVNTVLFYRADPRLGFVYVLLCFLSLWIFPDVFTEGPEEILYLSDKTLDEVMRENSSVVWVIEFFTTWSPQCHAVAPVFLDLAKEFATDYLRFAKLDAGSYPAAASKYGINTSTLSRQLPTIVVFENMKPVNWRPMKGKNNKIIKYSFTEENVIRDFGMSILYEESMKKIAKRKKKTKEE